MSGWRDFFDIFKKPDEILPKPGAVLINFVNRYLAPLDGIKYKIKFDKKEVSGITTMANNSVTIEPATTTPIQIFAWGRREQAFKLIDTCTPIIGKTQLRNERMKTYKQDSKTQPHPKPEVKPTKVEPPKIPPPTPGPTPSTKQGVDAEQKKNTAGEPEHATLRPVPDKITVAQLSKIFPAASDDYLTKVADELNADLPKYKLDTILRRAHFFAQVRQEAGSRLSPKDESLNYLPSVLIDKFSYYAKHEAEAKVDGRTEEMKDVEKTVKGKLVKKKVKVITKKADQETIANKAYGNRNGNGSIESGDGWEYRGRGIFQLTAKTNYSNFDKEYKNYWSDTSPGFVDNPDKVVEFPYYIRSAVWYWLKNSIYTIADKGSSSSVIDDVTQAINGKAKDAAKERRDNFNDLTYPAFK